MPESIAVGNDAFADYIKVASLPRDERRKSFRELSSEQKASFVKVQFAMQFVKRPNLTKQQGDFLLEAMSKVSADLYDRENPQKVALSNALNQETEAKVFGLFAQKDAFEILEGIGAGKDEEVALLQKYEDLMKTGMKLRKELVKQMPMAEKVSIWKTQLTYHLATSSFNQEQKEFIVKMMLNTQSIFEASAKLLGEDRTKYLEALESSMFKIFTKAEAYAVFMTVGIQKNVRDDSQSVEQAKVEYIGQSCFRPQTARLNLSNISTPSRVGEKKSLQFLTAPNSLNWICDCRWYCDAPSQSCWNFECQDTDSCGPFGTWTCIKKCVESP